MTEQQTTTDAQVAAGGEAQAATTTTDATTTEAQAATDGAATSTTSTDDAGTTTVDPQVKELRSENAATRRKLREAEEKLAAAEREKLTDLEKAQADAKAAAERATAAETRANTQAAKAALTSAAVVAKVIDPSIVHDLLVSKVEFDADGEPVNAAELVTQLVEQRPFLVDRGGASAGGAPGAAASGQQPKKAESREEFLARFGMLR